jgi:hypothetical protein
MKTTLRVLSVLFMMVISVSAFAACGGTTAQPTTPAPTAGTQATVEATEASVPFVAPPDQIGLVVSADTQLVTWHPYATTEDSLDFKSIKVKDLGKEGEMTLFYMEAEVTYYSLVGGKLEKVDVSAIVPGSVIGITTLEEGVQEVYILSVPAEEDDSDEQEDIIDEYIEETVPPTTEDSFVETPSEEPTEG